MVTYVEQIKNTNVNDGYVLRDVVSRSAMSGSFTTVGAYGLAKIRVYIRRINDPDGDFWLTVYAADGNKLPTGAALGTSNAIDAGTLGTEAHPNYGAHDFTFDPVISLAATTSYCIVMNGDFAIGANCVAMEFNNGTAAGHTLGKYDGANWSVNTANCQFQFITYSKEGTNTQINIGDSWKVIEAAQINIGDTWKAVAGMQINIGDAWKTIF